MEEFTKSALTLGSKEWEQVTDLAEDLSDKALLPVTGAGASLGCDVEPRVPSAPELAERLYNKVKAGEIALNPRPRKLNKASSLGDVAEAICLENDPVLVLKEVGFGDPDEWPGPEKVKDHACVYRILARMARERLIEETITFNYDCHHEAACRAEGFLERDHSNSSRYWPTRYGAVGTKAANASVDRRADFNLVKAHGCVKCWRDQMLEWKGGEGGDPSDAIVIRKSQLLDWRSDYWVRDIVSERVRRHILLLIGCSAEDPVIQISLRRLMEEVREVDPEGPARIRVLDIEPNSLGLMSLLKASGGDANTGPPTKIKVPTSKKKGKLGGVLVALLTEMLTKSLQEFDVSSTLLPRDRGTRTTLLMLTTPAMTRWSWWLLSQSRFGSMGFASDLRQRGDRCYVPLLADPTVTFRAIQVRSLLLEKMSRNLENSPAQTDPTGFVINHEKGAAVMPLGVGPVDLDRAKGLLRDVVTELATPRLDLYVALLDEGKLRYYMLPVGKEVTGAAAPV